jgi:hypothetical protein
VGSGVVSSGGSTSFDIPSLVAGAEGDLFLSVEDRAPTSQVHALRLNR